MNQNAIFTDSEIHVVIKYKKKKLKHKVLQCNASIHFKVLNDEY
jgi:hypothetical protein